MNKDLDVNVDSSATSRGEKRTIKIRHAQKVEGVFETGLDVIEHEFELEEDEEGKLQALRLLYKDGKLTNAQVKEMLLKKLKQEKIFGFSNYDEFFGDYFKKDLVALEDMNRVMKL